MFQVREARRGRVDRLVIGLVVGLGLTGPARATGPEPELTPEERQKLVAQARECDARSSKFYREGRLADAREETQQLLAIAKRLYPPARYPEGHPELARSLNNLGAVLRAMGRLEPARDCHQPALAMRQRLYPESKYPDGHPGLATSLNNLGLVLEAMGRLEPARDYHQQALAMRQRLYPESRYPDGHPGLATSLNNLGSVLE